MKLTERQQRARAVARDQTQQQAARDRLRGRRDGPATASMGQSRRYAVAERISSSRPKKRSASAS
nr:hypothetical protein [Haliangium ochraceum]